MRYILLISILFLSLFSQAQNYMMYGHNQNKKLITIDVDESVTDGSQYTITVTASEAPGQDLDITVRSFNNNNIPTNNDRVLTINSGELSDFLVFNLNLVGITEDYEITNTIISVSPSNSEFYIGTPNQIITTVTPTP